MNCNKCGAPITDGMSVCNNCGAPVMRRNGIAIAGMILSIVALALSWIPYFGLFLAIAGLVLSIIGATKRNASGKGRAIVGIVLGAIALCSAFFITLALSGSSSDSNIPSSSATKTTVTTTMENLEQSREDFIASAIPLDFKAIARNPDNYVGQNFYYVCYISSARTAKDKTKYFITYEVNRDEAQEKFDKGWYDSMSEALRYSRNHDVCVWLYDNRKESDPYYEKILENDIVIVYGTFNGMTKSQNSLTGETGEEVSLDIKYVEIIGE